MQSRTEDLRLLVAVVDSGGFSAAARLADVPVAKVSRAVQRLEQQLDTPLLNRTTRSVTLTTEGRAFVERVREGLAVLAQAEEQTRLSRERPSGPLRVDAATPFVLHQLVPLIGAFREQYPGIELELSASDDIINLLEQRTDVAIRIGSLEDSTLHARMLGRSPLQLVASPSYLERHGVPSSPAGLRDHQLLGFLNANSLNRWPVEGLTQEGANIRAQLSTSSGEVMRQLCLAGEGIACLSRFMIQEDLTHGRLVSLLADRMLSPHRREQVQAVYYRNTALSSRIGAFLDFITPRLRL
ncbi:MULTISPECIES: LysR family transcriptional regulator [Halomonadaceae]|jgi:DNA-binding transcriptional LysR family regulator|uniref:LysR family transcriptional regulator n=1 Tax=Halomonadaceae TaxID=28256 RepID=UPI0015827D6A|nr:MULTISPECIES: LysR family transcriptional regulator [Halomonas]MDI4638492.1 LysR family transcriptional regulator [Halomonas sp. BMC7]NUJ59479.1 LysR family transcriptional regulator [Halomonas taeanensis]